MEAIPAVALARMVSRRAALMGALVDDARERRRWLTLDRDINNLRETGSGLAAGIWKLAACAHGQITARTAVVPLTRRLD